MKLNIRNKFIIFAVLIILVPLGMASSIILFQLQSNTEQRSREGLQSNARVAHNIYTKRLENLGAAAQAVAQTIAGRGLARPAATTPPAAGAPAGGAAAPAQGRSVQDILKGQLSASQVSFIALLDDRGKVIAQHNGNPVGDGMYLKANPLYEEAMNQTTKGEVKAGSVVEEADTVEKLGLADRVAESKVEKGLFLEAAAPVMSGEQLTGVVVLGQLVNNDVRNEQQSIVNEAKETLYREMRDQGAVIVTLEDKIITTNLPGKGGGTAIGEKVIAGTSTKEKPSVDEQDFPDGSYRTSFMPIESVSAKTGTQQVGRIGVAVREEWFTAIIRRIQFTILIVTVVFIGLGVGVAVILSGRFTQPIIELTEAANRISLGELDVPITVASHDEIGTLAEALDRMRISLKQAIERLRRR
jgi:methyl-accepting chemotaxis protein